MALRVTERMNVHSLSKQEPPWSRGLLAVIAAGCIAVPCLFTTRVDAVFAVPKLAALWTLLALCLGVVAAGALLSDMLPGSARLVWRVDVAVLAFVALSLTAWATSVDRRQSLYGEQLQYQGVLTLFLYVGFFYVARLAVAERWSVGVLMWAIAIGATFVSGYALIQKAGLDPIWHGYLPGGRVFSSIGQANALAAYLVLAIPLSVVLALGAKRMRRALILLATLAMVAAFVFTRSRGGYLGLSSALLVLALGWWREVNPKPRRLLAAVATLVVVTVAIGASGRTPSAPEALRHVPSRSDASVRFHLDAWRVAAEIVKDHPLLGTGPETFPEVFSRYGHEVLPPRRALTLDAFRVESPHNVYLAIAAGSGIPSLIAYLAIVAGFFASALRAHGRASRNGRITLVAVLAAVTGHLATDAFMTAEITSSWLFWLLLGATLGWVSAEESGIEHGRRSRARERRLRE